MDRLPDLSSLSHDEKDALIQALWAQVQALTAQVAILTARVGELEARLGVPPKTPDNSSLPPSQGRKPNREDNLPGAVLARAVLAERVVGTCWLRRRTRLSPMHGSVCIRPSAIVPRPRRGPA